MKEGARASFLRWVAGLSASEREALVRSLSGDEAAAVAAHWPSWAHDGQCAPGGAWRTWVIMGGRGFGKTRAGAEWIAGRCAVPWRAPSRCGSRWSGRRSTRRGG